MMTIRIIGTGSYLPENIVTNDDLAKIMETSDEWISSRTGIKERHLVKEETTAQMSAEAAKQALKEAGMKADELDLIIVATLSGDYVTPSTACEVQSILGANRAIAFDINAACSGFMYAMNTAYAYIHSGVYQNALIIGAETLSKLMDWNDRSTCVLFGDGAGAAVVRADQTGLLRFTQGSDGSKGMVLACKNRLNHNPLVQNNQNPDYVYMDGQEVYKFAVSTVPASIKQLLEEEGLETSDIKYFLLHQANIRIIQSVSKRLKVDLEKFPTILERCGNISAGSVPILLDEVNKKGMLQRGDKIVLAGFGAGLTWSASVMEW
jgi:3-oxoacyl-[acyl-carrier-protein] synthase-3